LAVVELTEYGLLIRMTAGFRINIIGERQGGGIRGAGGKIVLIFETPMLSLHRLLRSVVELRV